MKIILLLLDGLGDRAYPSLEYKTPLESAATPNLDRLAALGSNGLYHTSLAGRALPSEIAHYLLFGYELDNFPGRGLLEAVGEGIEFKNSDVLCLAHFSEVTWKNSIPILTHGRDHIQGNKEEIGRLYALFAPMEIEGITFILRQTRRNDAVIILRGGASPFISDSDPITLERPIARICPVEGNPEAASVKTARALNSYLSQCHNILKNHRINEVRKKQNLIPANFLVTQRCGRRIRQEPFHEKWGLSGMLIASPSVYAGLAREIGLSVKRVKDSKDPGADLKERIAIALDDASHDFIHVHTKVPDEAAHSGDPMRKKTAMEALDTGVEPLRNAVEKEEDLLVAVTGDHSTPSISPLIHSGEPVPLLISGPNVRRDRVASFHEVSAAQGCLGFLRGRELMLMLLNYSDRSVLKSHQIGEKIRPYVPENYEPFQMTE